MYLQVKSTYNYIIFVLNLVVIGSLCIGKNISNIVFFLKSTIGVVLLEKYKQVRWNE